MKLLVIGGTQFVGREVVRLAHEAGHEVVLFNRGITAPRVPYHHITGDVAEIAERTMELREIGADAVIHCIANSAQDAANAAEVFTGTDTHVVALGSQDCYAGFQQFRGDCETTDFPITEDSPPAPPLYWKGTSHSDAETYDKNQMTQVLLDAHAAGTINATVLRLPMVYGPGDLQFEHRHGPIIHHVLDQRRDYVIGEREQGRIWTYGYITNVAAAILHAATNEAAAGRVFNIGEETVRTQRRWAELIAAAGDHEFRFHVVPEALLPDARAADLDKPTFHIIVECGEFTRATGFAPSVTLADGISRTLDWARLHPERIGPKPDYEARAAAAARWRRHIDGDAADSVADAGVERDAEPLTEEVHHQHRCEDRQ